PTPECADLPPERRPAAHNGQGLGLASAEHDTIDRVGGDVGQEPRLVLRHPATKANAEGSRPPSAGHYAPPLIAPTSTNEARISSSCAVKALNAAEVEKPKPPLVAVVRVS